MYALQEGKLISRIDTLQRGKGELDDEPEIKERLIKAGLYLE